MSEYRLCTPVHVSVAKDSAAGQIPVAQPSMMSRERAALLRLRELLDAAIPQVGPGELLRIVKRGLGEEVSQ